MRQIFLKTILWILLFFFLIAAFHCVAIIPYTVDYHFIVKFRIGLAGLVSAVPFCGFFMWLLLKYRVYDRRWIGSVIIITIFLFQLTFIFSLRPLPIWDCRSVVEEAARMSRNGFVMGSQNGYFERYGNNYAFTILLACFYRLLSLAGIQDWWTWSIIANAIVIDIAIGIGAYLLSRIHSRRTSLIYLLIMAICPITYVFTWYVYTNTFSILISMLILLCLYKLLDSRKEPHRHLMWGALSGMVLVFGCCIRITSVFIFISAVMCFFLNGQRHKLEIPVAALTRSSVIIVLSALLTFGLWKTVENRCVPSNLREENYPVIHWITMGHNPSADGFFYQGNEDYTRSFSGKEAKTDANLQLLTKYSKELSEDDIFGFYLRKIFHNWTETGFAVRAYAHANQTYDLAYCLIGGGTSIYFISWVQMFYASLYLLCAWSVHQLIQSRQCPLFPSVLAVTLFGALLFYLFWEISHVYSICFVPILALLAAYTPEACLSEQKYKILPSVFAPMSVFLLLAGFLASPPKTNSALKFDCWSVNAELRRPDLEETLDSISQDCSVIQDGFSVQKGKTAGTICFFVYPTDAANGCDYLFSLYDGSGTLLHQQLLDYHSSTSEPNTEFHCTVLLPERIGEGNYTFSIAAVPDGRPDGLRFIYAWYRVGADINPGGDLYLSGKLLEDRELQFNVY